MPRFYFHLRNATGVSFDNDGIDLPDATVAHREARISAHELTREMLVVDALALGDAVLEVVDHNGTTIASVSFLDAAADPLVPKHGDVRRHRVSVTGTRN